MFRTSSRNIYFYSKATTCVNLYNIIVSSNNDIDDRITPCAIDLYGRIIGWNVDLYFKTSSYNVICNAESLPGIPILTPRLLITLRQNRLEHWCIMQNHYWFVDLRYCRTIFWNVSWNRRITYDTDLSCVITS